MAQAEADVCEPAGCLLSGAFSNGCGSNWGTQFFPGATNEGREIMTATGYSRLAAVIFSLVALLQFVRALAGWPITIADTTIPLWPSWVACVVAAGLAWLGF